VDARNVLRSQWPNIPEHEVVSRSAAWAAENDARALVVFDGRAPGGLVGEQDVDQACSVVGTGRESADDWLIRAADELTAKNSRYWLVTSDRALRAIAGRAAERTIGGGAFSRELRP
jgi:predicted RNA-binding protein with PIN domain